MIGNKFYYEKYCFCYNFGFSKFLLPLPFFPFRVNGKLVALKVIRLQEEEGTPFTAIREGMHSHLVIIYVEFFVITLRFLCHAIVNSLRIQITWLHSQ